MTGVAAHPPPNPGAPGCATSRQTLFPAPPPGDRTTSGRPHHRRATAPSSRDTIKLHNPCQGTPSFARTPAGECKANGCGRPPSHTLSHPHVRASECTTASLSPHPRARACLQEGAEQLGVDPLGVEPLCVNVRTRERLGVHRHQHRQQQQDRQGRPPRQQRLLQRRQLAAGVAKRVADVIAAAAVADLLVAVAAAAAAAVVVVQLILVSRLFRDRWMWFGKEGHQQVWRHDRHKLLRG
eukprot:350824-Chlamydomonas_euryale.AAC.4